MIARDRNRRQSMVARDAFPLRQGAGPTATPGRLDRSRGWLGKVIEEAVATGRWAFTMNKYNDLFIDPNFPLTVMYNTEQALLNAMTTAVQGEATKAFTQAVYPAAGADLTLTLTPAVKVFGVMVRITDAPTSFKYGYYPIELRDNATVRGRVWVQANKIPVEVLILNIANNNGVGTIVPNSVPIVFLPGSANVTYPSASVSSSTFGAAEGLNERDLGDARIM